MQLIAKNEGTALSNSSIGIPSSPDHMVVNQVPIPSEAGIPIITKTSLGDILKDFRGFKRQGIDIVTVGNERVTGIVESQGLPLVVSDSRREALCIGIQIDIQGAAWVVDVVGKKTSRIGLQNELQAIRLLQTSGLDLLQPALAIEGSSEAYFFTHLDSDVIPLSRVNTSTFDDFDAITRSALYALAVIHTHGILHQDPYSKNLTTRNSNRNRVSVHDFEKSRFFDDPHDLSMDLRQAEVRTLVNNLAEDARSVRIDEIGRVLPNWFTTHNWAATLGIPMDTKLPRLRDIDGYYYRIYEEIYAEMLAQQVASQAA